MGGCLHLATPHCDIIVGSKEDGGMCPIGLKLSTLLVAAAFLSQPVLAQRGGTAPGSTGGGTPTGGVGSVPGTGTVPGNSRTPTNNIPNTVPNTTTPQQNQLPPPIFVSGRVMLEDGTPPSQSVPIERVCSSGNPHTEGYTDSRGYFSLQLGQRNGAVMPDASEDVGFGGYGGMGRSGQGAAMPGATSPGYNSMGGDNRFMLCDLRARLAGYRSQSISLVNHRAMDNPDIGVILLHRIAPSEGSTVSARTLAAPKAARKAYEKGLASLKKKKNDQAEAEFQKAVSVDSEFSAAWYELGRLQAGKDQVDAAQQSFNAAIKSDPKFVLPYIELSFLDYRAQKWQALADVSAEAAKLDAFEYPQAYLLNALANYNMKNYDAAEKSAREAEKIDTHHRFPKSSHILGVLLANKQDYTGAAEEFRNYLKFAPNASDAAAVKTLLERVEQANAQGAVKQQQQQ
jgi:tetratricopeptide (TPR) repeat protein